MSFPQKLTSVLTGATLNQLTQWRTKGILTPELPRGPHGEVRYSFRDVIALRSMVALRSKVSLQAIRRALNTLVEFEYDEHLSSYRLVGNTVDGRLSVAVIPGDEENAPGMDLVVSPGQTFDVGLWEIFEPFTNFRGEDVVSFLNPAPHLEVKAGRLGGWPTISATRIGYDQVAALLRGPEALDTSEVSEFYPLVSAAAAQDALTFDDRVKSVGEAA